MSAAERAPSPNTVCVPTFQRWQPRQPAAARRSDGSVRRAGRKSAALPVASAVLVSVVMLLALGIGIHGFVDLLEKARVRLLAMLPFGVLLRALLLPVGCLHRLLPAMAARPPDRVPR